MALHAVGHSDCALLPWPGSRPEGGPPEQVLNCPLRSDTSGHAADRATTKTSYPEHHASHSGSDADITTPNQRHERIMRLPSATRPQTTACRCMSEASTSLRA